MKKKKVLTALLAAAALLVIAAGAFAISFCRGGGDSVYISPSAQDENLYAGMQISERASMNALTDRLESALEGICTVYSADRTGTLDDYIAESNALDDVVHIALHSNASGREDSTVRGCEIYVRPGDWESRRLAECIYEELSAVTPDRDRGIKPTRNLRELKAVHHTAVLIEVDFHDNAEGAAWIVSHYPEIADAIARGVGAYMNGEQRSESLIPALKSIL